MARKNKIVFTSGSDEMEEIDAALTAAMNALDGKNQEIADLLTGYDVPVDNGVQALMVESQPESASSDEVCG